MIWSVGSSAWCVHHWTLLEPFPQFAVGQMSLFKVLEPRFFQLSTHFSDYWSRSLQVCAFGKMVLPLAKVGVQQAAERLNEKESMPRAERHAPGARLAGPGALCLLATPPGCLGHPWQAPLPLRRLA